MKYPTKTVYKLVQEVDPDVFMSAMTGSHLPGPLRVTYEIGKKSVAPPKTFGLYAFVSEAALDRFYQFHLSLEFKLKHNWAVLECTTNCKPNPDALVVSTYRIVPLYKSYSGSLRRARYYRPYSFYVAPPDTVVVNSLTPQKMVWRISRTPEGEA